jgi:hypothetical protein
MQHAHAEIPQQESAIFTNTPKTVVPIITTPWIKTDSGDPGLMALAPSYDGRFGNRPN